MHTVFIEFREKFLDIKQNSRLYRTDYYPSLQVLDNLFSDPQVISCFQNNAVPARCLNTTYKILNIIQYFIQNDTGIAIPLCRYRAHRCPYVKFLVCRELVRHMH